MTEARDALDRAWRELEADALASDGRITDRDVKDAIKRNRARIEAAAVAASEDDAMLALRSLTETVALYRHPVPMEREDDEDPAEAYLVLPEDWEAIRSAVSLLAAAARKAREALG